MIRSQLEQASSAGEEPRFTIKEAVALETRLPMKACATKDIDLVVDDAEGLDVARILDGAPTEGLPGLHLQSEGEPRLSEELAPRKAERR